MNTKFKVGDRVRIVRKVPKQAGWGNSWILYMDKFVGRSTVYTINRVDASGVGFDGKGANDADVWDWPSDALEYADEAHRVQYDKVPADHFIPDEVPVKTDTPKTITGDAW